MQEAIALPSHFCYQLAADVWYAGVLNANGGGWTMLRKADDALSQLLIPELTITPSQFHDSRISNQIRLLPEQKLLLGVLVDGIFAFKDFVTRGSVIAWINSDERDLPDPPNYFPFLFCIENLGLDLTPAVARAVYMKQCREYEPTILRTISPLASIAPRHRESGRLVA
jgi:hypothetical protein